MERMLKLILVLVLFIPYLVEPIGLANAVPEAMPISENFIQREESQVDESIVAEGSQYFASEEAEEESSVAEDLIREEESQANEPIAAKKSQSFENEVSFAKQEEIYEDELLSEIEHLDEASSNYYPEIDTANQEVEEASDEAVLDLSITMEYDQEGGSDEVPTGEFEPISGARSSNCIIIAEGQFADQAGANGLEGASWRICEGGLLEVGEGFINWTENWSPWSEYDSSLIPLPESGFDVGDDGYFDEIIFTGPITAGESLQNLFSLNGVRIINGLEHFDTSQVTNMRRMFNGARSLTSLDLSSFDTSSVIDMSWMFNHTHGLTGLDLSNFDTTSVTDMNSMFRNVPSLTSLDLSSFDTSAVVDMWGMFSLMTSLTSLDLSSFDTSSVTTMREMFDGASNLTSLDLSNFDTSSVTDMLGMFGRSGLISLDLSNFDTSQVTLMGSMFSEATSLTSLDLSSFDTSAVTYMGLMFNSTSSLTSLNLSNFDTSSVSDMRLMFSGASTLASLDLSNFNTTHVTNMSLMFEGMTSLGELALGENFEFVIGGAGWMRNASLPPVPQTTEFTGYWQNVGDGTIAQPRGSHVLTSEELMGQYDGSAMADTFVWQRRSDQRDIFTVTVIDAWLRDGRTSGEFAQGDVVYLDPGAYLPVWIGIRNRLSWEFTPSVEFNSDDLSFIMPASDIEVRAVRTPCRAMSIIGGEFADPSELTELRELDDRWWGFAEFGATVTIRANAIEGYRLVRWENILTSCDDWGCILVEFENETASTTTFVVPSSFEVGEIEIRAVFEPIGTTGSPTAPTGSSTAPTGSPTGTTGSSTGTTVSPTGTTVSPTGTTVSSTTTPGSPIGTLVSSTGTTAPVGTTTSSARMTDPTQPSTGATSPPNQPGTSEQPSTPNQPGAPGQNQPGVSGTSSQPVASARPSLPQTGAVVGLSFLGGTVLLASGLAIASKKKKSEKE